MTRFDAATADARRELFVDAIRAHTERESAFLTIETAGAAAGEGVSTDEREPAGEGEFADEEEPTDGGEDAGGAEAADEGTEGESKPVPWVQYADGTLNLDCTDDELEQLKSLLEEFPAFTIDDLATPEEVDGTNVRVMARTDDERVAAFVERVFRQVYDRPDEYRAWITAV